MGIDYDYCAADAGVVLPISFNSRSASGLNMCAQMDRYRGWSARIRKLVLLRRSEVRVPAPFSDLPEFAILEEVLSQL
jgi:hypothetical protein